MKPIKDFDGYYITHEGNVDYAFMLGNLKRCEKTGRMVSGL